MGEQTRRAAADADRSPGSDIDADAGMVAVSELLERLEVVRSLDAATGPIKVRERGFGAAGRDRDRAAGGQDFLVGLDRVRADAAGQLVAPGPGLASTTAAGLARRCTEEHWRAWRPGWRRCTSGCSGCCRRGARRAVRGRDDRPGHHRRGGERRKKQRVDYNYQGQRAGRPHVAIWAETETPLAADLGGGLDDPRADAHDLMARASAGLPAPIPREQVRLCADAGYFAGRLARAAHAAGIGFAIGAKRLAPLWRLLDGIDESRWADAKDTHDTQVAVADYRPADWPEATRLLIRRVRLTPSRSPPTLAHGAGAPCTPTSAPCRSTRSPTDAIYGYSFIATNLDVATPERAVEVEHWYLNRTTIENVFRDSKDGAALGVARVAISAIATRCTTVPARSVTSHPCSKTTCHDSPSSHTAIPGRSSRTSLMLPPAERPAPTPAQWDAHVHRPLAGPQLRQHRGS